MSPDDRLLAANPATHRTILGALGLGGTLVALAMAVGPVGIAAGIGLVLVGLVAPPLAVFGVGQAMLLVVLPAPTATQLALVQGTLFLLLLDAATRWRGVVVTVQLLYAIVRLRPSERGRYVPDVFPALLAFGVMGGLTWLGATRVGLLDAAAGLVVGVGVVGYVVHRYERVALGLAGDEGAVAPSPATDEKAVTTSSATDDDEGGEPA